MWGNRKYFNKGIGDECKEEVTYFVLFDGVLGVGLNTSQDFNGLNGEDEAFWADGNIVVQVEFCEIVNKGPLLVCKDCFILVMAAASVGNGALQDVIVGRMVDEIEDYDCLGDVPQEGLNLGS